MRAAIGLGCGPIVVHARRADAAAKLTSLRREGEPEIRVAPTAADAAAAAPSLVLQATPAGGVGGEAVFDFASLPARALVLEMIVAPVRTANEEAALAAGHRTAPGIQMLLHQAREQVRLLTGRTADYYAMRMEGATALRAEARSIVLVGLRCSGKTQTGSRLARLLGRTFIDTDRLVESRAGRSPDEMIRAGDEAGFRAIEEAVLRESFAKPGAVIATGGGAALHADLLDSVSRLWPVVLLDAAADVLLARWEAAPRAPLSNLPPAEELARQRAERLPVFRRVAAAQVDTSRLTADEAAELIAGFDDVGFEELPEPRPAAVAKEFE